MEKSWNYWIVQLKKGDFYGMEITSQFLEIEEKIPNQKWSITLQGGYII